MHLNEVNLIGRLGEEPESKDINNIRIARISVATNFIANKNGEKEKKVEWHSVVAYQKLADIAMKYLKKGDSVYIKGSLRTNNWTDKEGVKRYRTEIMAREIINLTPKYRDAQPEDESAAGEEEMPF